MSLFIVMCIVELCMLQVNGARENTPVIQIPQGKLMGLEVKRDNYRAYLGIPYGTVDDRFQEAGPPPRWLGVFNASEAVIMCAQYHDNMHLPVGIEDCLILNVYTPGQVSNKRLNPVMVHIHGGGYKVGRSNLYNPGMLVKKGVIVVTVNYRLGPFGFLCLRIKGAPGNAGLKDQVAALQWVQNNIKYFGGNPDAVTVFGESAGSASVNYLILSPAAKGLFKRAIMESGSALSPVFAYSSNPIETASLVASKMGYNTKNPYDLLSIFKNATKNDILIASETDTCGDLFSKYNFRPCVEKPGSSSKPFLTMNPQEVLASGSYNKVPMIIGYNDKEGILYVAQLNQQLYPHFNENVDVLLPENLHFSSNSKRNDTANKVKSFYFGDSTISENTIENLIDFVSDVTIHYPSFSITEHFLNHNNLPIYNYYFKYDSRRNFAKISSGLKGQKGATHGDELFYLFDPVIWSLPLIGTDAKVVERMTGMWTNFAKFGNPTTLKSPALNIDWEASDEGNLRYLIIDKDLTMDSLPNPERIEFWREIYSINTYNTKSQFSNVSLDRLRS